MSDLVFLDTSAKVLFFVFLFLFGIVVGSFLNVLIFRIPLKEDIAVERSHCMHCGHVLQWYELIPLFLTCDEIQQKLSAKLLDDEGNPIPEAGKRGKPATDSQGNIIWQRLIKQQIHEFVEKQSDRDLKISMNQSWKQKEQERATKREALQSRYGAFLVGKGDVC